MWFLAALAIGATGVETVPLPVILTTDFGVEVDDQWALTHLALSPRVDLRAVVTTHAPGLTSSRAAEGATAWLARLALDRRPAVVAGSTLPLADAKTPRPNPGVDLILRESKNATADRRLTVFVIGAATDLASALLIDPSLSCRVDVVAMGFSRWPEGGDPWNVKNDLHAWQALLESDAPLTIGDEAVCKHDLAMSSARAHRLLDTLGATGEPLVSLLENWLKTHRELVTKTTGTPDAWPIWDEVTVAHLLRLTTSETVPRPRLRDDLTFDHSQPRGTIQWIRSVKTEALWADLVGCLRGAR